MRLTDNQKNVLQQIKDGKLNNIPEFWTPTGKSYESLSRRGLIIRNSYENKLTDAGLDALTPKAPGRQAQYESAAEKQRAYRESKAIREQSRQDNDAHELNHLREIKAAAMELIAAAYGESKEFFLLEDLKALTIKYNI